MKREQIIEIIWNWLLSDELSIDQCADEIMALPLDLPSKDEIDKWADLCASNTTNDVSDQHLIKAALSLGASWEEVEIIKRNVR